MGTLGNPQSWGPYEEMKDCSQGFCSVYCPQWCYILFPPPPPLAFSDDDSKTNFSPLVIAIIGILASAFLLVSYYTVISKYCGSRDPSRRNANQDPGEEFNGDHNQSNNELWHVSTTGLDEATIKLITVCKYKKGDGLVEGTDCSVCLSEFQENESLRLLPKCSHAFHLFCIDTWLKSHSNCPMCRAHVLVTSAPLLLPPPVQEIPSDNGYVAESEEDNETTITVDDLQSRNDEFRESNAGPKSHTGETGNMRGSEDRDIVIEIKDGGILPMRRSVSMDSSCQGRVSIADILSTSEGDESDIENHEFWVNGESSSKSRTGKSKNRSRVLHCVTSPTPMKRSFSSGRFLLTRQGRVRM